MDGQDGLTVRRSTRYDVVLRADIAVADVHDSLVCFSSRVTVKDDRLSVDVVDFSAGGLGIMCTQFIPRKCMVRFRVFDPLREQAPPLLEGTARVQRIQMTDRRPGYLLGTSFEDNGADFGVQLDELLRRMGDG
jgi:hypothetical protein